MNQSQTDTVFVYAPAPNHNQPGHPEHAGRAQAIWQLLEAENSLSEVVTVAAQPATVKQLARVHSLNMVERVRAAVLSGRGHLDADTYVTSASYDEALLAAGGACAAVDAIMTGRAGNGLAVVRPPGHHAESQRPGGFCLFNNIAVAARQAQVVHGVDRVAIIDFDIHHGNGTQAIFYEDDSVLFLSTHLYGAFFYPGTGAAAEIGAGPGRGFTVNVPLPVRVGDAGYSQIFDQIIRPKVSAFQPDLILVSAGFDAHWADPLASGGLSLAGYATICRMLLAMAVALGHGRVLFILEGGYLLPALSHGVLNLLRVLRGHDALSDPLGPMPHAETSINKILEQLKLLHLLN
jgi:acetoin utilization deacetylase AcuC-like enzyme